MTDLVRSVINRRFRLLERWEQSPDRQVFLADDAAHESGQALVWLFPPQSRAAVALAAQLDAVLALDCPGLLTVRATGLVASGAATGWYYVATERPLGKLPGDLSHEARCAMALDIARTLSTLHGARLSHRRLTPSAIVRGSVGWKLAEAGMVSEGGQAALQAALEGGSLPWLAPEVLAGKAGRRADMWALGAILLGAPPYGSAPGDVVAGLVAGREPRGTLPAPLDIVVAGCLLRDPSRRWTAEQVVAVLEGHPPVAEVQARPTTPTRTARVWPTRDERRLLGPGPSIGDLAWTGRTLAVGSEDGAVRLLLAEDGQVKRVLEAGGPVTTVALNRYGGVAAGAGTRVRSWAADGRPISAEEGAPVRRVAWRGKDMTVLREDGAVWAMTADGRWGGTLDGRLLQLPQGTAVGEIPGAVLSMACIGDRVVVGGAAGLVMVLNGATHDARRAVLQVATHRDSVAYLAVDRSLNLLQGPELKWTLVLEGPVTAMAFSPDGRTIAAGSADGTLRLLTVPH